MGKKVKIYESEIKRAVRRGFMEKYLMEDYEMKDTYSTAKYKQSPREAEIEDVFGEYGEDIPRSVLRYMRKNPQKIIKRLYDVYGQQMFDYISQKLQTPELDIQSSEEMMIDEVDTSQIEDRTKAIEDLTKSYEDLNMQIEKSKMSESIDKVTKKQISSLLKSNKGKK